VANETRAEFAKGLAEAMKRSVDKKADHLDWEHRLEEAAAQPAAAGGKEVSRCRCHRAGWRLQEYRRLRMACVCRYKESNVHVL
jgi:hypothetical protein